jgi:hypothetical protein
MRPLKALGLLLVACIISMGSAEVLVHPAEARGRMDSPGGPDEHSGQDMTAKSITATATSGAAFTASGHNASTGQYFGQGTTGYMAIDDSLGSRLVYSATEVRVASGTVAVTGDFTVSGSGTKGTKTLSAGSATQAVATGSQCVCSNTSTATVCKASVSGTTATFTSGAGTDVVAYICL